MQDSAARFRQRKRCDEEHARSQHRENRDGVAKRCRIRERADQKRKPRADAAAEIVAEALAGSAKPGRIEFSEECADTGEITGSEEAERETEKPQHLIGQRQLGAEKDYGEGADREVKDQVPPPKGGGKPRPDEVADNRADDQRRQIAG